MQKHTVHFKKKLLCSIMISFSCTQNNQFFTSKLSDLLLTLFPLLPFTPFTPWCHIFMTPPFPWWRFWRIVILQRFIINKSELIFSLKICISKVKTQVSYFLRVWFQLGLCVCKLSIQTRYPVVLCLHFLSNFLSSFLQLFTGIRQLLNFSL